MPGLSPVRAAISLAIAIALTAVPGCSRVPASTAPQAIPVHVARAVAGPAAPPIAAVGTVVAKDEIHLSFKVGGVIGRIDVHPGQAVRRGERLAEIELTEIGAQVAQARELAGKAVRDLTRGERLYADQVISLEQLQDLRTQAALQQAALRSAEFNLDYAVIRAPQDGVVLRKLAEAREQVPAGQTVLILGARDRGYVVRANLADREIVQVQLGDPVTLRLDAFPGTTASGRVTERASAADERTGLFTIEVRFDTEPEGLVSGLVAKLDIRPASALRESLAHVPIAALVEGDHDRAAVFLIDAGHARRRAIRIGFIAQDSVAVAAGLAPGDLVATDGALYLEDGTAVRVMDAADAAARE